MPPTLPTTPLSNLSDTRARSFAADGEPLGVEVVVNGYGLAITWSERGDILLRDVFRRVFNEECEG